VCASERAGERRVRDCDASHSKFFNGPTEPLGPIVIPLRAIGVRDE
jgi:hypothetical protein